MIPNYKKSKIGVIKFCEMCQKKFITNSPRHIFCGTLIKKTGCSYKNQLKLSREWAVSHKQRINEIARKSYHKLGRKINKIYHKLYMRNYRLNLVKK